MSLRTSRGLVAGCAVLALVLAGCSDNGSSSASGAGDPIKVSLIIKTTSSPYFLALQKGAEEAAKKDGVDLTVSAGKDFNDTDSQIQAIENAVSLGQDGIIITPNGQPVIDALAQARDAGIKIIELDDVPDPVDAVDGIFATDNRKAGNVIGEWTAATLKGAQANIALLDAYSDQVIPLDYQRDQGFLEGMGIDVADPDKNADEEPTGSYNGGSYNIVCNEASGATEDGGRTAIENCLQKSDDINVVYTINEPAAAGAYEGLKALGKADDVLFVSIDGGCDGIRQITSGHLDATAQQYPSQMAALGVKALVDLVKDGTKPTHSEGLDFYDTGVKLVTDQPVDGVDALSTAEASEVCWG
jgi:fructose transport system substrate-binding protein